MMRQPLSNIGRLLTAAICVASAATANAASVPVGVQRLMLVDQSRPQVCEMATCPLGRQIPVLLFYPARVGSGRTATFEELGTVAGGKSADHLRTALRALNLSMVDYTADKYWLGVGKTVEARINRRPSGVLLDAPEAAGRYPLVVYAGGANFMVQENVTLWRELAEHGYVVAAIPTIGPRTVEFSANPEGLQALSRDMEQVLAQVHSLPNVDDRRIAFAGFSYGGAAAVLAAMEVPAAKAVVGYDASFISKNYGRALTSAPQFAPDRLTAPLLDIHAVSDDVTDAIVGSLRYSERHSIEVPGADHIDFTQMPEVALAEFGNRQLPKRPLDERAHGHSVIAATTLHFLDAKLKNVAPFAPANLPAGWSRSQAAALPVPPSASELVRVAQHDGYHAALQIVRRIVANDPKAELLSGPPLNNLGYAMKDAEPQAGLLAFRLNLAANPNRSDYWDSLADGFKAAKDDGCVAATYRAELELLSRQASLTDMDRSVQKTAQDYLAKAPAATRCTWLDAHPL